MKDVKQRAGGAFERGVARFASRVPAAFALLLLAGCGGDDPVEPPPDPPRAAAISISPESATLTMIGETATFTASVTDQNGAPFSGTVAWTSDAPQVFSVDANGTVTAVANGSGTVMAAIGSLSATASVTVNEPARAARISITPNSVTLTDIGETATLSASLTDQFGQPFNGAITWSSDATDVFTVDENGVVTAVANGSGTVTAAHESLSATASVTVDAPENLPPRSKGTLPDYHVAVGGGTLPFLPQAHFEDPDNDILELTFTASVADSSIASVEVVVDEEGHVAILMTGLAPGMTTVTVTATDPGGLSGEDSHALTVDDSGFTPYPALRVENGKLDFGGVSIATCTPPIVNAPNVQGFFLTVNRSWWQARSDSTAAWADIEGTEVSTSQLCPHSSQAPGEYRLVFDVIIVIDEHYEPIAGHFRSENYFAVEESTGNQAPTVNPTAPRNLTLSMGGGPYFLTPQQLFADPNGDELTFSVALSDSAVLSVETLVDNTGRTHLIATGMGTGSGTLTITATDPGGLTAELAIEVSVDDSGYTPHVVLTVSNGALHALGRSFAVCLGPLVNFQAPDGFVYTLHSSKWQTRSDASAAWTDIEGTERTDGMVCPFTAQEVGDYRLAYESTIVVDPAVFSGRYASSNFFTVSENQAPVARGTPDDIDLAVGGGSWPFLPGAYFDDPGGHNPDLTYTAVLSDPTIASAEVTVDSERHVSIIVTGTAAGTTTLTITATDPGGLSAEQSMTVTVDDSGFTPIPLAVFSVADNRLDLGGFSVVGGCSQPITAPLFVGGPVFIVNSSKWQTRSDAQSAWTDVEGTEMTTGVLCSHTSRIAGEYRLVMQATIVIDEHQAPITGDYRSGNSFVVEDDSGENEAPAVNDDAPRDFRLSVGGGPFLLTPAAFFGDPNGDPLTFSASVSDEAVLTAEILVDSGGHTLLVATGKGVGRGTVTITASDPGGLTAELPMDVSVDDTGYTPYNTVEVANGVIRSGGFTLSTCLGPIVDLRGTDGYLYTVRSSMWQSRSDASAEWADIEGTETTTGQLCPHSAEAPGDYRLVYSVTIVVDEHIDPFTGNYASSNFFTVSSGG